MDEEYERKREASFLSLFLIYAALFLCLGILPANLDIMRAALDATRPAIARLMAIDLMVLIVSILFFGYYGEKLSEKYSLKKIFIITQFGWVACFGLFVFSQNFLQFSILHVLSAVFRGAYVPIAFTMISDFYPPKERGVKFSVINVGLIIGAGGGLLFGTLLGYIPNIGWRLAYGLGFILAVLAVAGYATQGIIPRRGKYEPELQDLEKEVKYDYKITFSSLKQLFKKKSVGVLLIAMLITGVTTTTLGTWALDYFTFSQLTILGADARRLFAMIFFMVAGLGAIPGNIWGGKLGDKYYRAGKLRGRVVFSLVGIIVGFTCFFGFYLIPLVGVTAWEIALSSTLILGLGFLGFLFTSLSVGNQFAIYSEVCMPEVRASANSLHGVMVNIGGIFGNLLLAFSITGYLILPFYVAILISFGIIGGLLWIIPLFTYPLEERECRDEMVKRRVEMEQKLKV